MISEIPKEFVDSMVTLGPIGLLILAMWWVYLRYGDRPNQLHHKENVSRLERIEAGVNAIFDQLKALNGRMVKIEEWRDAHDKQDDERYDRHQAHYQHIEREIDRTRDGVHALRNDLFLKQLKETPRG